jgi:hypothetical protein
MARPEDVGWQPQLSGKEFLRTTPSLASLAKMLRGWHRSPDAIYFFNAMRRVWFISICRSPDRKYLSIRKIGPLVHAYWLMIRQ